MMSGTALDLSSDSVIFLGCLYCVGCVLFNMISRINVNAEFMGVIGCSSNIKVFLREYGRIDIYFRIEG